MRTWTMTWVAAATAFAASASATMTASPEAAAAVAASQQAAPAAEADRAAAPVAAEIGAGADATVDAQAAPATLDERAAVLTSLTPVDSIPAFGRLHSWSVVDDDTLIIWATPFRPYLVELFRPSPELRFAISIGVTSFGSRIYAKFDAVQVDGFSYPIERIYEMSRDEAEAVKAKS